MNDRVIGWALVAVQGVLLAVLGLLPGSDHWPTPTWVETVSQVAFYAGLAIIAVAALRLGRALTPTPVPTAAGELTTTGLYRFARHPIYSGVLLVVFAMTFRSGHLVALAVGIVTYGFFHFKAQWEEARLAATYPGYADYASTTPRFFPRIWPQR